MSEGKDYLKYLNEPQRDAVLYTDGPELVIAGAGSGKTRVLTYKIVHLLRSGFEPYRILALTFTNKAADEMRERICSLVGEKVAAKIWMGTFHSVFARILRMNAERIGFRPTFTIYDTADSKSLLKTIIKTMELDEKVYKPSTVLNAISMAKNHLISPEMYEADKALMTADRNARRPYICEIYKAYRARLQAADAMDFDDLLYYTNLLLRENPDIASHYQEFFKYILVDEYQDTNYAQHAIVSVIAKRHRRLCVVGDDAQSIYSFRGANIGNILNLGKEYDNLAIFRLEQNYRSTKCIVNAANSLIKNNRNQIEKNVFSENETGERIEVAQSFSDLDEAYLVVNRIRELHRLKAVPFSQFAILFRTNAQSRPFEEQFRKYNIPYIIYKGQSFYQRKEIKDALAYCRLTVNPDDDEALRRVINFPARGIGETTLKKLQTAASGSNVSIWEVISNPSSYPVDINSGTQKKIALFSTLVLDFISKIKEMNAWEMVAYIIRRTGMKSMLLSDSTPENISRMENLDALVSGVRDFVEESLETMENPDVTLTGFLQNVALASDQDESDDTGESVKLMTVHSAKGLEFDNVVIVGVEDDLFPSAMSKNNSEEIAEERRLLYVAITRARKFCMLTYTRNRFRNGMSQPMNPSPFLSEIDRRYLNILSGDSLRKSSPDTWQAYERMDSHSRENKRYETPAVPRRVVFSRAPEQNVKSGASDDFTLHSAAELSAGLKIEHSRFGMGEIISVETSGTDAKITVRFANADLKTLLLKFARFKVIGEI